MLKSFMQPGTGNQAKTDSTRTTPSAYASSRTTDSPKPAESVKEDPVAVSTQAGRNDEGSKLIVGPNIKLKGSEITDCEILVVEGRVEASMNSRDIRIAEGGVFSGKAEIDVAEVRGVFDGEITARKRLVIYATGKVSGTIRYGSMMIEEGGTLSGDVARLSSGPSLARLPESPTAPSLPEADVEKGSGLEQIHSGSTFSRNQRRQG
jgi:cytoskeletal protein CcmA (bactofilin family)